MRLAAKMENLGVCMDCVRQMAGSAGLAAEAVQQVELAVEELLVNIINYAYTDGMDSWLEMTCEDTADSLILTIRDGGVPFNPTARAAPDIDLPVVERGVGGLGIFLAGKVMDGIRYRRNGGVNITEIWKNKE